MTSVAMPERTLALSDMLEELADEVDGGLTVGEMVEHLGRRAFGALLFAFSAPNWLPLPPGSSSVLGLPLVLFSPQLMIGVHTPWMPRFLARRRIPGQALSKAFRRIIPWLEKVEHLSRPRLTFLFGPIGDRLIGLVCLLLSLVLLLPIPLGNMAPAAAIALLGLGMVQRDGALVILGYIAAAISAGLLVIGAQAALFALRQLMDFVGLG